MCHSVYCWDICSIDSSDCKRPAFNRSCREVSVRNPVNLSGVDRGPFSLAVSIGVFATSIGSLLASSYSTFCTDLHSTRPFLSYRAHRWKEARFYGWNSRFVYSLLRCCDCSINAAIAGLAIHASHWVIPRSHHWNRRYWRYLRTRGTRDGLGHLLRGQ